MFAQRVKSSIALSVSSGLLLVVTFPKFNLFPLSAVALAPLLIVTVQEQSARRRFLWGFLAGCAFFAGTLYWVYGVMRNYGGLGVMASSAVFALFFVTLALYWGLFGYLAGYLWKARWGPLAIPFFWVSIEFARAHMLSGFPWLLLGYALTDYYGLARVSRWTGVYGLSYLLAAVNVAWVLIFTRRSKWAFIHLGGVLAVVLLLVLTGTQGKYSQDEKAYLVQTNIPEQVAFEPWDRATQAGLFARLKTLTVETVEREQAAVLGHSASTPAGSRPQVGAGESALVIWPETPAPFYFDERSFSRQYAEEIARQLHSYFLMGIVGFVPGSGGTKPLNSEVLLDPAGTVVSQYDKIHLVPFGEYVPLKRWLGFAGKLTAEVSDFVPGSRYVVSQLRGGRMAGFICYEAIFPDLVRRFVKEGAEVLVNTSNDGWYGSSAARYQHLLMARMRAIENARYLLRATNTGMTAIISPEGTILKLLPPDQPGVLEGNWSFLKHQTFYSRHGDWFAIGACLVSILALTIAATRQLSASSR